MQSNLVCPLLRQNIKKRCQGNYEIRYINNEAKMRQVTESLASEAIT